MVKLAVALISIMMLFAGSAAAQTVPSLAGCPVLPEDNVWNTPVDHLPVDGNSPAYIATIGSGKGVHPDFGAAMWDGGPIGIPYTHVQENQPRVDVVFVYADESDPGPYPIPPDAPIEGGSNSGGDRHVLVVDTDNCVLYETFSSYPQSNGSWFAGSGAVFDLRSHLLRPSGWTSADAAGLPILPGLVRYEEVAAGEIRHALRFTAPQTQRKFVWPARHYASSLTASNYPPMGKRFRLKAHFDTSTFAPEVQVILRALKRYGMILADNGSAWYISGAPDPRWNDDVLVTELRRVTGSDFEAVDETSLIIDANSGQARQPTPSPLALTSLTTDKASPQPAGTAVTFTATASGGTTPYQYRWHVYNGSSWSLGRDWRTDNAYTWTPSLAGSYQVQVWVRNAGTTTDTPEAWGGSGFQVTTGVPLTLTSFAADKVSPQRVGTTLTFTAAANGGTPPYEYRWYLWNGSTWSLGQPWSAGNTFTWTPSATGSYQVQVWVRNNGTTADTPEAWGGLGVQVTNGVPLTLTSLTANKPSPQPVGTALTFTVTGTGGVTPYQYKWWIWNGSTWSLGRDWATGNTFTWTPTATGTYSIQVWARNNGAPADVPDAYSTLPATITP